MYNFKEIITFIKKNEYESFIILCVIFLISIWIFRLLTGQYKYGTWSPYYYYKKDDSPLFLNSKGDIKFKDSKGERECKRVMESIFRRPFIKVRPNFLHNPVTGNANLELDCYNPDLRLAVEYNGKQHYEYTPYFHKNKEHFLNQKYRDELKRRMCRDNKITLIEVPYTIKQTEIANYLQNKLYLLGILN